MKIRVTRRNIRDGAPGEVFSCPVALALKDHGFNEAAVGYRALRLTPHKPLITNPTSVARFIARFDNGRSVKPFEFTI